MNRKGWFIPILIFFISITGLIFYQKSQDLHTFAETTNLPPILWSESSPNINRIVFSENGHQIEAARTMDEWMLKSPISSKADNFFIYNVIQTFKEPTFAQTVDTEPANLEDYGIDSFSPHLKLYTNDDESYELIWGKPADSLHYYVYSPMSNTIYIMSSSTLNNIHTDLSIWRDKTLLAFNKTDIRKIELSYNSSYYTLMPSDLSSEPIFKADGLDEMILTKLINFLQSSTINHFITDTADDGLFKAYGFDNPALKISITLKSGERYTVTIGRTIKEENLCYVVTNHSNSIVTIPYFDLSKLTANNPSIEAEKELPIEE